jgi:hypothetical protein
MQSTIEFSLSHDSNSSLYFTSIIEKKHMRCHVWPRRCAPEHEPIYVYAGLLLGAAMITVFYQNPQFTGALADASVDLRRSLVH